MRLFAWDGKGAPRTEMSRMEITRKNEVKNEKRMMVSEELEVKKDRQGLEIGKLR